MEQSNTTTQPVDIKALIDNTLLMAGQLCANIDTFATLLIACSKAVEEKDKTITKLNSEIAALTARIMELDNKSIIDESRHTPSLFPRTSH